VEAKHDVIFDEVVAACRAKHLRDVMSFQKNWNNEIIAQFYATLYVEERGGHEEVSLDDRGKVV
jgi:Leu/Phe-tRNA-protein transferase